MGCRRIRRYLVMVLSGVTRVFLFLVRCSWYFFFCPPVSCLPLGMHAFLNSFPMDRLLMVCVRFSLRKKKKVVSCLCCPVSLGQYWTRSCLLSVALHCISYTYIGEQVRRRWPSFRAGAHSMRCERRCWHQQPLLL